MMNHLLKSFFLDYYVSVEKKPTRIQSSYAKYNKLYKYAIFVTDLQYLSKYAILQEKINLHSQLFFQLFMVEKLLHKLIYLQLYQELISNQQFKWQILADIVDKSVNEQG